MSSTSSTLATEVRMLLTNPRWPHLAVESRIAELNRLFYQTPTSKTPFLRSSSNSVANFHGVKDLDAIFVLIIGDIFGSSAVKYGLGWNLTSLSRSKAHRDFNAVLGFLGSSGTLMQIAHVLQTEHNATLKAPSTSSTLTPVEYYLHHFIGVVNTNSEFMNGGFNATIVDNDSLYPVLFEDYLTYFLPMGGGHFRVKANVQGHHHVHQYKSPDFGSPINKHSLLRNDFRLLQATSTSSPMALSTPMTSSPASSVNSTSLEMKRSLAFVETVVNFWLNSWVQEPEVKMSQVRLPNTDVIKMARMFVKHVHYFLNSFHPTLEEVREATRKSLALEKPLLRFVEFLFDHWPLDSSFRLIVETWLSYVQPWRYKDVAQEGVFAPCERWERFIVDNLPFYDALLAKIVKRFSRVDLTTNKNAYILFRVVKVFSQDQLPKFVQCIVDRHASLQFKPGSGGGVVNNVFDEKSSDLPNELFQRAAEAKFAVAERMAEFKKASNGSHKSKSWVDALMQLFDVGECGESSKPNSEYEEMEKTVANLDTVLERLGAIFPKATAPDAEELRTRLSEASRLDRTRRPGRCVHDDTTELTPQKRLDILNRVSKYSPKFNGNPDEMPLRSDEFHFLARLLYSASLFLNAKLPVKEVYANDKSVKGVIARELCAAPTVYRVLRKSYERSDKPFYYVQLPARINLRPLASHAFVAYFFIFLLFGWLLGSVRVAKFIIFFGAVFVTKIVYKNYSKSFREETEESFN